jgi:hypothetical protein
MVLCMLHLVCTSVHAAQLKQAEQAVNSVIINAAKHRAGLTSIPNDNELLIDRALKPMRHTLGSDERIYLRRLRRNNSQRHKTFCGQARHSKDAGYHSLSLRERIVQYFVFIG